MKKIILIIASIFMFVSVANAGELYFRAGAGPSIDQTHDIEFMEYDLDPDVDNPGISVNGAIGYKSTMKNKPGWFGEVESGYQESEASTTVLLCESECRESEIGVETLIKMVHVMFNVGYEHPFNSISVMENDPLKLAVYAGAGPVFGEIQGDFAAHGQEFDLSDLDGSTALGWQVGGNIWLPVFENAELGLGVRRMDRGDHRTPFGVNYNNTSIDTLGQIRIFTN